jgi:hypothetical protein
MAVLFNYHSSVGIVCCCNEKFTIRDNIQHHFRQYQLKPREIMRIHVHKQIYKNHIHRESITPDGLPN